MEPVENKKEEAKVESKKIVPASKIKFDDFAKVEIKVGKILSAEKVPDTDKLLKLSVDFGMKAAEVVPSAPAPAAGAGEGLPDVRQIVSGISLSFPEPSALVGKKCMFVTNLEPRTIRGLESNGMILTISNTDGTLSLLETPSGILPGTKAK